MKNPSKSSLLAITWPIFVEQLAHVLPGIIDTVMVSHLGDAPVAGLTVANQVVTFFIIVFSFVAIGGSVVITHHLGAGEREGAMRIARTAVAVNIWMGAIVSVAIFAWSRDILTLLHLPHPLMPFAQPFLALMGGTLLLEAFNIACGAALRAHGHTRDAMLVTVAMNVVNVALNWLLIFGLAGFPRMGIVGAALSTVISRALALAAFAILVHRHCGLTPGPRMLWNISRANLGRILHIGMPAAGENLCWWMSYMVITSFVAQTGTTALATFSYAMQVSTLVMLMSIAIGMGTEIMVGHMVGAGRIDDAYRQVLRSLRFGFGVTVLICVPVAWRAQDILGLFTSDGDILLGGAMLLHMSLLLEPGRTFNLIVINSLRAAGDARFPVFMGVLSMWGIAVALAWLFGIRLGWGLPGIWLAFALDEWVRGISMYLRWKSRAWEHYAGRSRAAVELARTQEAAF